MYGCRDYLNIGNITSSYESLKYYLVETLFIDKRG